MNPKYPEALHALISHLKKLPGVGTKTAERFGFEILRWEAQQLGDLSTLLSELLQKVTACKECGCLTQEGACQFCNNASRDSTSLCILSSPRDVFSIEETKVFRGLYHVIEHLLSPLDGRHASALRLERIEQRIERHSIKEIILAFDSTLEGDATALFVKQQLSKYPLAISRLAFGLPVGSSLEYVDGGTLAKAIFGRQTI